jgi:hypothetical protein
LAYLKFIGVCSQAPAVSKKQDADAAAHPDIAGCSRIATALNALIRRFNMPTLVGYSVTGGSMRQLVVWVWAN